MVNKLSTMGPGSKAVFYGWNIKLLNLNPTSCMVIGTVCCLCHNMELLTLRLAEISFKESNQITSKMIPMFQNFGLYPLINCCQHTKGPQCLHTQGQAI